MNIVVSVIEAVFSKQRLIGFIHGPEVKDVKEGDANYNQSHNGSL